MTLTIARASILGVTLILHARGVAAQGPTQLTPTPAPLLTAPPAAPPAAAPAAPPAKDRLTAVESKVETLAEESKENNEKLSELKSGKLIKYGITGGIAFALQMPFTATGGSRQKTVDYTSMPYLLFLPAYWRGKYHRATHTACASQHTVSQEEASKVARKLAREDAEEVVDALLAEVRVSKAVPTAPTADPAMLTTTIGLPVNKVNKIDANGKVTKINIGQLGADDVAAVALLDAALAANDAEAAKSQRAVLVERVANKIWAPLLPARCVAHKWGIWAGVPLPYDSVIVKDGVESSKRVTGRIAGGLAFSPNAYISFLLGFSYSVYRPDPVAPATEAPYRGIITPTFSIGGNLDILTLIGGR